MRVHFFVAEPHHEGFVADQTVGGLDQGWKCGRRAGLRLVVALGIGDGFLAVATVGQGECEIAHVPLVVGLFFQPFDVHVWDGHGETVVEPDSAESVGET